MDIIAIMVSLIFSCALVSTVFYLEGKKQENQNENEEW